MYLEGFDNFEGVISKTETHDKLVSYSELGALTGKSIAKVAQR